MYLDVAASTKISAQVKEELLRVLDVYGNPSSLHKAGVEAKKIILDSTDIIANKINCKPEEIIYTTGATMGNNLIIRGFFKKNPNAMLIYSSIEHNDIMMLSRELRSRMIRVDKDGRVDLYLLKDMLDVYSKDPVLVSIQLANGEIGTVQNIYAISDLVKKYDNAWLHTDATQYIAHYPVDVRAMGIDALTMSGQKINCMKGIGMAFIGENTPIQPLILGEQGFVGGTENTLGIACLGKAFDTLEYDNDEVSSKRTYLYNSLKSIGTIIGKLDNRLPNNLSMIFDNVDAQKMVTLLSEDDIYVSTGSACSSGKSEPSHVIMACGYTEEQANSCIRFTIDNSLSFEDLDYVVESVKNVVSILKGK